MDTLPSFELQKTLVSKLLHQINDIFEVFPALTGNYHVGMSDTKDIGVHGMFMLKDKDATSTEGPLKFAQTLCSIEVRDPAISKRPTYIAVLFHPRVLEKVSDDLLKHIVDSLMEYHKFLSASAGKPFAYRLPIEFLIQKFVTEDPHDSTLLSELL